MQFASHATSQDLVSETRDLCDADSTSYPIAAVTRRINAALEELVGKIVSADGDLEFDDTNYTDAPRGTGNLVEGQEYYTYASEYLKITAVDILDTSGVYRRIKQLSLDDLVGLSPEEYFGSTTSSTVKGFPQYYDPSGDSFRLYPAPAATDVTLTAGYRIWFKRTVDLFTTTDTTQEPGIPAPYHILLAYMAAVPYCMAYKKDRVALYEKKIEKMTEDLLRFYGKRNPDRRPVMTMAGINYI